MKQAVPYGAVIYSLDNRALAAFYERVAGLRRTQVGDDYVLLESPGFQLVLLQVPAPLAESMELENPPRRRAETPIKLFLNVSSIAAARETAKAVGGEIGDREWSFNGIRRCDGVDPEGNVFQVQEA